MIGLVAADNYAGIAAVIAALTGLVAAVGTILNGRTARAVHSEIKTANGQTIGELTENTAIQQAADMGMAPPHESSEPGSPPTASPSSG